MGLKLQVDVPDVCVPFTVAVMFAYTLWGYFLISLQISQNKARTSLFMFYERRDLNLMACAKANNN